MDSDRHDFPSSRSVMTCLFVDVRHFSSYAETADVDDIVTLLNDITSITTSVVSVHQGDVDKVIGDGVLATFSGAERKTNALKAAIEIVEKSLLQTMRESWDLGCMMEKWCLPLSGAVSDEIILCLLGL